LFFPALPLCPPASVSPSGAVGAPSAPAGLPAKQAALLHAGHVAHLIADEGGQLLSVDECDDERSGVPVQTGQYQYAQAPGERYEKAVEPAAQQHLHVLLSQLLESLYPSLGPGGDVLESDDLIVFDFRCEEIVGKPESRCHIFAQQWNGYSHCASLYHCGSKGDARPVNALKYLGKAVCEKTFESMRETGWFR